MPVSEKEDIPVSSLIVLAFERNKPKPGIKPGSPEASLSMYSFAWILATSIHKLRIFTMVFPMCMNKQSLFPIENLITFHL